MKKYLHAAIILLTVSLFLGWKHTQLVKSDSPQTSQGGGNLVHLPIVIKPIDNAPIALTETPTATPTEVGSGSPPGVTNTPQPTGPATTRFNFEVAGHEARGGPCIMNRYQSDTLLTWNTVAGETDSASHPNAGPGGWIPVNIPHVSIYVEVFCDDGSGFVRMDLYNGVTHPSTGETVGWLTREIDHAIEIGWPDGGNPPTPVPPTNTPVPPTNTPIPPTNTPVPPTDTPTPLPPTDTPTPIPPTDTPTP